MNRNNYIWNEQIVSQKCFTFMAEADSEFEHLKNMDSVIKLRKLFDLPYNAMIHNVNELMLAVDFDSIEKGKIINNNNSNSFSSDESDSSD